MAHDTGSTTTKRSWPLVPLSADITPQLWVKHTATTKNVGTPQEIVEHEYVVEIRFPRVGRDVERTAVEIGRAADSASFTNVLNTIRAAIVDARDNLATM